MGNAPSGAGGDTFRSAAAKINENFSNWDQAASRQVGVEYGTGNLIEVSAFGLGLKYARVSPDGVSTLNADNVRNGEICHRGGISSVHQVFQYLTIANTATDSNGFIKTA